MKDESQPGMKGQIQELLLSFLIIERQGTFQHEFLWEQCIDLDEKTQTCIYEDTEKSYMALMFICSKNETRKQPVM